MQDARQLEHGLDESLKTLCLLTETLKNNNKKLEEIESLLKTISGRIRRSNECINTLEQENRGLKLSIDVWMQRAIKLEFDALKARDAENKP